MPDLIDDRPTGHVDDKIEFKLSSADVYSMNSKHIPESDPYSRECTQAEIDKFAKDGILPYCTVDGGRLSNMNNSGPGENGYPIIEERPDYDFNNPGPGPGQPQ